MPWTKVLCSNGETHTFAECLECNHECFDLEIRETLFLREVKQNPAHTGKGISGTGLLGCLRSLYLDRITDYAANPSRMWYSLRGELLHKIVERPDYETAEGRRMAERRLYMPVNGIELSGQLDLYRERFLAQGLLKDWKSTGDFGLQYIIQDGAKWEHIQQVNIYKVLAEHNGFKVDQIRIVYMSLMDVVATGCDAVMHEYLVGQPEPKGKRARMKKVELVKAYPSGKNKWACTYEIPEVPIYKTQDVMDFIGPRVEVLRKAFYENTMPGLPEVSDIDPKDRAKLHALADIRQGYWKCNGYCDVWRECAAITPGWAGPNGGE